MTTNGTNGKIEKKTNYTLEDDMKAYAKLNLTLDITGKRDDGYHTLDSVMQTISLYDTVNVYPAKKISIISDMDINTEDNIVYKAAIKFFEYTKINSGAKIILKKRIPLSAGLGGGSSDAAAVINSLNKIYNTNLSDKELISIAKSVGADVPFLLKGGTARVRGIGEDITPLPNIKGGCILLIKEMQKVSTKELYKMFDKNGKTEKKTEDFCRALYNKKDYFTFVGNDFLSVYSQEKLINEIKQTSPLAVSLSGSGPTLFALYKNEYYATKALKTLNKQNRIIIKTKFI